ncbi:NYN domain-containing protein [Nonomuraea longicatena]|uniref:NYN domain-containing protein n=1 Tax=Nonomuraea longicatena TaxID=83682 RepID=A0ABN1PXK9_9ACTN
MDRCALFVDAGYLLADGAMAVHGTRHREAVAWDYPGLLQLMTNLSRERTGLPLLRCYWYEATVEGRRTPEHDALADLPGLKLRLSRIRPGRREGVDAQVHRDLMTLARNSAVCDAVVVSGDEDLAQVVCDAQDLGIRVTVVHITADGGWAVSRTLRQESDDLIEIGSGHLRPYVSLVTGAAEAVNGSQPVSNGQAAHASLPAALPPAALGSMSPGSAPLGSVPPASGAHGAGAPGAGSLSPGSPGSGGLGSGSSGAGAVGPGSSGLGSPGSGALGPGSSGAGGLGSGSSGSGASGAGVLGSGSLGSGSLGAGHPEPGAPGAGLPGSGTLGAGSSGAGTLGTGTSGMGALGAAPSPLGSAGPPVPGAPPSGSGAAAAPAASTGVSGQHGLPGAGPPTTPAPSQSAGQPGSAPSGGHALPPGSGAHASPPGQSLNPASGSSPGLGQAVPPALPSYSSYQQDPAQFSPTYQPLGPYTGPQAAPVPATPATGTTTLADAVQSAHREGHDFGESVARDAPALWLEAVLARKPRMPSDLEARLLQGSSLPIDFLLHDEVRHALRRGFWDALERARR